MPPISQPVRENSQLIEFDIFFVFNLASTARPANKQFTVIIYLVQFNYIADRSLSRSLFSLNELKNKAPFPCQQGASPHWRFSSGDSSPKRAWFAFKIPGLCFAFDILFPFFNILLFRYSSMFFSVPQCSLVCSNVLPFSQPFPFHTPMQTLAASFALNTHENKQTS